jgi:hypothetical protein
MDGVVLDYHGPDKRDRFPFPVSSLVPSHILGILSLILLTVAIDACYGRKLTGAWSRTYAATSVLALYLNVFVLIVQLFQKVRPSRRRLPRNRNRHSK